MPFFIKEVTKNKANLYQRILNLLPKWFGRADATKKYAQESACLLMLGCFDDARTYVGFLSFFQRKFTRRRRTFRDRLTPQLP
jgi:hypothetical protein